MTKDEFMRRADDAIYMNNLSLLQGDVDALFGELERLRARASEDADRLHKAVAEVERLRAERDEARDAYKFRGGYVEDASGDRWWSADLLSKVEQERDAARAEVERLREHFEAASPEHNLPALLDLYDARRTTAEDERDEARAEVERLRASEMNANGEAHGMATERRAMLEHIERMQELIDSIATIVGTPGDDPGDLDGFEVLRLHVRATVDALQIARDDADAARAEVERLRARVRSVDRSTDYNGKAFSDDGEASQEDLAIVASERDEARAEVERLREALRTIAEKRSGL